MPTWQRAHISACLSACVGAVFYVLCDYGAWPKLMYLPYDRQWLVARQPPDASATIYLGMVGWAVVGAIGGGLLSWVITRRVGSVPPSFVLLVSGWAGAGIVFGASYYLWSLWPF